MQLIGSGGGGGGKGSGGTGGTPSEAKDNLESTAYAKIIDLIGEGEIEGFATPSKAGLTRGTTEYNNATLKDIFFDKTPILRSDASNSSPASSAYNFKNVTVHTRFGTSSQSRIPFGNEITEEIAVGVTVEKETPVTRTIVDSNVDEVRLTITVPQLQEIETDGDIVGSSVTFKIQVQYKGGGFTDAITDTITGRTADQYQRSHKVSLRSQDPSNYPVDIRVVRVTNNSSSAKVSNAIVWTSYTEVVLAKLNYPYSALVGLRVNAEQFSSIPQRSYRIRGLKVKIPSNGTVSNSNGRITYSGSWDGTFAAATWTSDPAWCLYDLLIKKRYGLGEHIAESQLDKWSFYEASKYCSELVPDGFGGTEPRFSCNANIQSPTEAYTLINDLASVMRAMPYWSTGALTLSQDRPQDSAYLFTMANVTEEGFSYSSSDIKARPNVAVVGYMDLDARDTAYEQVEDRAAILKYGIIKTEITAFACTSRGQAARIGEWLIYANAYEAEVVTFTASIEAGVIVRPGQVIEIADPVRAGGRRGGRIVAATSSAITVDDSAGLPASGTVSVVMPDGTIQARAFTRSAAVLTLATALPKAPQVSSIWVISSGGSIETSTWRVLSVQEQEACQYVISAIAYNSSKYNYIERNRALQQRDVSNLTALPAAPTNLALSETLYRYQGQVRAKVLISWRPVLGVNQYRVRWRKGNGNWNVYTTASPDHEILNITPGRFDVEVYSLNALNKASTTALTGFIDALGKTAPPANVTGFNQIIDPDIGVLLGWDPISDIDLRDYEIRSGGSSWETAVLVTRVAATTYKIGILPAGTTVYRIKARDTSNVLSAVAASVTVTITGAAAPAVTNELEDPLTVLRWSTPRGSYSARFYELRYGDAFETGTLVAQVQSNSYSIAVTWSGARTFWVAAVDPVGTIGAAGSRVVTIAQAAAPTVSATFYGRTCNLTWNGVRGTLRTRFYEISYGSTYASRSVISRISSDGRGYSVPADWSGTRRFWVVAVDGNENYGTPGSVDASIATADAPAVSAQIIGENTVLKWSPVQGTLETAYYEVRRGSVWSTASLVGRVNATTITFKTDWSGTQRFLIRAVDINGLYGGTPESIDASYGAEVSIDVVVSTPLQPLITQQVVDNNVLLRWNDCTTTLPIVVYELRRGATWESAAVIGEKKGGFTTVFETTGGTYTYWLAAKDTAGTYGTPGSVSAVVNQPPDYILNLDQNSTFSGTKTNAVIDGSVLVLAVNTTETYEQHFTTRSWSTPQDQIDAGFTRWVLPGATSAVYEETIDYGAILSGSKLQQTLTNTLLSGSFTVTPRISVRATTGDAWTDYNNTSVVYATSFRYIKFQYDFTGAGGDDLMQISALNYRLDTKLITDTGNSTAKVPLSGTYSRTGTTITVTATAHGMNVGEKVELDFTSGTAVDGIYTIVTTATNSFTVTSAASGTTSGNVTLHNGGVVVTFSLPFVDVQSIVVTPSGTTAKIAIYDFQDAPNPTTFKVLMFDTSGSRVSGGFSWTARGT